MENKKSKQSGLGIAGMVIGIIAILLSCLMIGGILGVIGLILSIIGISEKSSGKGMAIAGIALNIISIIIAAFIFMSPSSDFETKTNQKKSEENLSSEKKEIESESEQKSEFFVGDLVETSDLKILFLSAEEYISDNEFIQPKEGNIFYKMEFEFENISDSDKNVSSYNFNCYADDYDMEQHYMDGTDLDATLSPGKKTKGSVYFEVPADSSAITIEYETNFWTENKIVFIAK